MESHTSKSAKAHFLYLLWTTDWKCVIDSWSMRGVEGQITLIQSHYRFRTIVVVVRSVPMSMLDSGYPRSEIVQPSDVGPTPCGR